MFQTPGSIIDQWGYFGHRETGLTHPDLYSYIRLADNGDIHLFVAEGVGIILSATQRSIVLVGDTVKFFSREDEGLQWNSLAFNQKAVKFNEPAFVYLKEDRSMFDGIDDFISLEDN